MENEWEAFIIGVESYDDLKTYDTLAIFRTGVIGTVAEGHKMTGADSIYRLVECGNAMSGIPDPALWMRETQAKLDAAREALREAVNAMERMDAALLKTTDSPKECEKGEVTRCRAALALLTPKGA